MDMDIEKSKELTTSWVQLYADNLYSWALHKTASKETAEDLVQETFLEAVKSFSNFKGESNPKTWLFSILNNKINDVFRKKYRSPIIENDSILNTMFDETGHWRNEQKPIQWKENEDNLLDNYEFLEALNQCLQRLPQNWFSAIQLKFTADKKSNEICTELGITNANFWQILHRAKLQLRKCIEINWFNN